MDNSKFLYEYMLNKLDFYENEKIFVLNRISLHSLNSQDYYDLLVTEIREDTAREIFRSIRSILDTYFK